MFTKEDIAQIEQRGSSVQTVEEQVERFKKGFPWMKIVGPATPEKGIQVLDDAAVEAAGKYYEAAKINGKCKFVHKIRIINTDARHIKPRVFLLLMKG